MAGTDFVFNISKGKIKDYVSLPNANDALIAVLLQDTGLDADAVLKDFDDLAALIAANTEATAGGYARQTLTSVTATVDDSGEEVTYDAADIAFGALAAGNTLHKLVIVYDPDTTTGTDSTVVPVSAHNINVVTDGSTVTFTVANFARSTD